MAEGVVAMGKGVNKRVETSGRESDTKRAFFNFCGVWKILYGHKTVEGKEDEIIFQPSSHNGQYRTFPGHFENQRLIKITILYNYLFESIY
jgi:hypothetical protein